MWRLLSLALAAFVALVIGTVIGGGGGDGYALALSAIAHNMVTVGIFLGCIFVIETGPVLLRIISARRRRKRSQLLDSLLPLKKQKDVYANLDELMPLWVKAHGRRTADKIRRRQMRRIVIGHYVSAMIEAFAKVAGIVRGP